MRNPLVVPTILHIIIPCVLLFTKAYNDNLLWFSLTFFLSMVRIIITFSKLCESIVDIKLCYFVLFLDFAITILYIVFAIVSSDGFIAVFSLLYIMGFMWECCELKQYVKSIKSVKEYSKLEVVVDYRGEEECCICYEGLKSENVVVRLSCDHMYHKECIEEWFKEKRICPYCRHKAGETNP